MQQIRMSLRGTAGNSQPLVDGAAPPTGVRIDCVIFAVVLMGKNTMIRKALRGFMETNPALEKYVINHRQTDRQT